jgi:hypothetical protein
VDSWRVKRGTGPAHSKEGIDTRTLQAYLGHRSINSTTRYAALAPGRFKNILGAGVGVWSGPPVFPKVRIPWKGLVQSFPISGGSVAELSVTDASREPPSVMELG